MPGPLDGICVLDLTRLLPGAFATALLADLGAEVIKVEAPGAGDPMRAYEPKIGVDSAFHWVTDRNKRSLVVDLSNPRGSEVVVRLAKRADVALESFRPGVADRLGVGEEALRAANPALVYCSLTGFGSDGPLADQAGHDINYLGYAGLASLTGVRATPAIPGTQIADLGGSLFGVAGILAALVAVQRTGQGDRIDISLTDAAFNLQALALAQYFATDLVPGAGSEMLTGGMPCYQLYECADGRWLAVGALESRFWRNLCAAIERTDLAPTQHDAAALPVWRELFASRTRSEWLARLEPAEACCGPVNNLAEAVEHPQLRHREMIQTQVHPTAGAHRQLGLTVKLSQNPGGLRSPAPILGQDSRAILTDSGFTAEEVDVLVNIGVIQDAAAL